MLTRLAALGPARSARPGPDGVAPAARVRPLLQDLADAAADAEDRPRRRVPELGAHALGDQLVVLVTDVRATVRDAAASEQDAVLAGVAERLTTLRRQL